MKKIFTLVVALMGFAGVANAATEDDLAVLKHSYVLVCDELGGRPGAGVLFGDNHFLDLKGGTTATNKGQVDLSVAGGNDGYVTEEIAAKYGEDYAGPHYNYLRLKNTQDMIAMKPIAGSKIIFFLQGNNKTGKEARYPKLSKKADLSDPLNAAPTADFAEKTVSGFRMEYTVPNDWGVEDILYVGSYNGDMFLSFIIVEAAEAEGTPSLKLGAQQYDGSLWYREVTCKTVEAGGAKTVATYTTDGSTPDHNSPVYKDPIKCYNSQTIKFQAYYDWDDTGVALEDNICDGAENEISVNFSFDAPSIAAEGANVAITSPYEGAKNFYSLNGGEATEGSSFTLTESATVSAYSEIVNGTYATFTTKSTTQDVYVLNPIKTAKRITATGTAVIDEEATETSTTGAVYKIENGEIIADKADFFVKNPSFGAVMEADYQVPEGQEVYIKMSDTNITFQVAEGDSVTVKVTCSKNACKNIDAADAEDGSQVNDRKCVVNVNGKNYTHMEEVTLKDQAGNDSIAVVEHADLKLYENANIIEFGLTAGTYTFQKYSGTGNILISSIEITPAAKEEGLKGDVTGDGKVNGTDIQAVINLIVDEEYNKKADVNEDNKVNGTDIQGIINIIVDEE